jgi:hypothetical protein
MHRTVGETVQQQAAARCSTHQQRLPIAAYQPRSSLPSDSTSLTRSSNGTAAISLLRTNKERHPLAILHRVSEIPFQNFLPQALQGFEQASRIF